MRSAMAARSFDRTKRELLLFEGFLKHLQHCLERLHANRAAPDRAEMLLAVSSRPISARKRNVDETFFAAGAGGAGEPGNADRDIGMAALERAFGHRQGDDLRHRVIMVEQAGLNP